ncbi:MAG: LysR family transcriptional regulator [Sphaerochaetaceae bacterium]
MDLNIQKYIAFIATIEFGSFTKAAEHLHYTQSAISRMIHALEDDWGMALLERNRGGVRLTSDGTQILPYAKRLVQAYDVLNAQIQEIKGLQTGLIRIGTFSSVATHWMPKIIKEFQKKYPDIAYELLLGDYQEIERWIAEGRVDCGFVSLPVAAEFEAIPLRKDELMVVMPKNNPLERYKNIPIALLEEYPFILLEKGAKSDVAELFKRYKINPKINFTTWDDYVVMSMVESSLGLSILPNLILKRIPYDLVVRSLEIPEYREIGLAYREKKSLSYATRTFIEYLRYID